MNRKNDANEMRRYVLARHLTTTQVVYPPTIKPVASFRGESVFPRSSVLNLKSAENWMRQGRVIGEGEVALKMGKVRASTKGKERELNVLRDAGTEERGEGPEVMQGLYAERQTELYVPPPVINVSGFCEWSTDVPLLTTEFTGESSEK